MTPTSVLNSVQIVAVCVQIASCHSWIACTDYLEQNGDYWNPALCRAFARHGSRFTPRNGQFGEDKGYNVINPPESAPCRTSRNDAEAYDGDHPMAAYYTGQTVVIVHPTKVRYH